MKSKTSFFNGTILRKNLQRCIPLIAIDTIVWATAMPLRILNNSYNYLLDGQLQTLSREILDLGHILGTICSFVYAPALAMVLFSYLYQAKSANMIHAFPVRREGLFLTNYLSGLLAFLMPNLLILLCTALVTHGVCMNALLQWFLMAGLQFTFFFSFAVLLAQITGHIVALPILYCILNFAVVVLELILSSLLPNWIYGMPSQRSITLTEYSPVVHIFTEGSCQNFGETEACYHGWNYLWTLFAVGAIFTLLAFLFYRSRRIEFSGDVIAISPLRPVFKYCFSFGCSIVLGALLISVLGLDTHYGNSVSVVICMLVGAFLGYYGSEMALRKRINVFTQGWIGFIIVCAVIVAVPPLCHIDAFGYSSYQPDRDEIVGVNFDNYCSDGDFTGSTEIIDTVYALHTELIENPPLYENDNSDPSLTGGNRTFQVSYLLQDGRVILREYEFFITDNPWHLNYPLVGRIENLLNQPTLIMLHNCPTLKPTSSNIVNAELECYNIETNEWNYYSLTSEEALNVYEQAVLPDIQAGNMFRTEYRFSLTDDSSKTDSVEETNVYYLSFHVVSEDLSEREYMYISASQENPNTYAALSRLEKVYQSVQSEE